MLKQYSRNVHGFECNVSKQPQHVLQISDVHFDSVKCDRELLTKHLKQAASKNALVFINGDFFDLMGGKYDPRSSYSDIRPEYMNINYLDAVIEDAIQYLKKFKTTYFIGRGNHETNISKRMHTDPIDRLIQGIRGDGIEAMSGGYSGWMVYRCKFNTNAQTTIRQHYHHGSGGHAPRSKGILSADIDQMKFPDADIITRGHDHNKFHLPRNVVRLDQRCQVKMKTVHHLRTGSYKKLGDGFAGWAVEKGFDQPRLGGWWMRLECETFRQAPTIHINEAQ